MKGSFKVNQSQFIESVKFKLSEVEFFYDSLTEMQIKGDKQKFTYFTSAFTSAARSILQYCYEFDKKRDSKTISYQSLLAQVSLKSKFAEIRNTNIHEQSLNTLAVTHDSIEIELVVAGGDSLEITETVTEESIDDQVKYYFIGDDYFDEEATIVKQSNEYLNQIKEFVNQFFLTL